MNTRSRALIVSLPAVLTFFVVILVGDTQPSHVAFPGKDGQFVFTPYDESAGSVGNDIWAILPDGYP